MTKKIGIIIGIVLMMSFLSGLSATTKVHIHNIWLHDHNFILHYVHPDSDHHDSTWSHYYIDLNNLTTISFEVVDNCSYEVIFIQGDRILHVDLPSDYNGYHEVDYNMPDPWQILPSPGEDR